MKIVTQDQNQLVAHEGVVGAYIGAVIMIVVGLALGGGIFFGSHQAVGALFGLIPIAIGVLLIVSAKARTLTIDKGAGTMNLNVKTIFGAKDYPYSTSDAQKIQLVTSIQQEYVGGGGRGMAGHEQTEERTSLLLILKDGNTIDLADATKNMSTFGIFGKVPNQGVGQQVATFLGVPFETAGPPSLGQVVQGVTSMLQGGAAPSFLPGQPQPPNPIAPVTPPQTPAETPVQPAADSDQPK